MPFTNSYEFLRGIVKDVHKDISRQIDNKKGFISDIVQQNMEDMNINDSGYLASNTFVEFKDNLENNFNYLITVESSGTSYAQYVHFSTGTNKIYPNRRYLQEWVTQTKDLIFKGSYQRKYARGSPNKKYR
jgi:hypothetical protein